MARSRRVLRKIKPPEQRAFDDRLWPINLSVLVLVSFVSGILLVRIEPEDIDQPWWRWGFVLGMFVIAGLVMWALRFLQSRYFRRGLQLALVLSLLIHAILALVMVHWRVQTSIAKSDETPAEESPAAREETVQEIIAATVDQSNRRKADFLRPVETQTPETDPREMTRRIDGPRENEPRMRPAPVKDDQISPTPSTAETKRKIESLPHQAEFESMLSRRPKESPNGVAEPVPFEAIEKRTEQRREAIAESSTATREEQEVDVTRHTIEPNIEELSEVPPVEVARKSRETSPDQVEAPQRNPNRVANQPQSEPDVVDVDELFVSRTDSQREPEEARRTEQQRRSERMTAADPVRSTPNPAPAPGNLVQPKNLALHRAEHLHDAPVPTTTTSDRSSPRSELDPRIAADAVISPKSSLSDQVATAPVPPQENAQQIQIRDAPKIERVAELEPAPLALSRDSEGRVGSGSSENLGQSAPARTGAALVASAAARRAQLTQTMPQGPALTPSQISEVPSLRAGVGPTTSTTLADTVEIAMTHGSHKTDSVDATSSAMSRQAASDASIETITATVGTAEVDFGPQRVISEDGTGRSAGGGGSELSPAHALKRKTHTEPPTGADGDSTHNETHLSSTLRSRESSELPVAATVVEHLPQRESGQPESARLAPADTGIAVRSNPTVDAEAIRRPTAEPQSVPDLEIGPVATITRAAERSSITQNEAPEPSGMRKRAASVQRSENRRPTPATVPLPESASTPTPPSDAVGPRPVSNSPTFARDVHELAVVDIEIEAPDVEGPGGILSKPNDKVGSMTRRASRDADLLVLTDARFLLPDRTGAPSISGTEKVAAPGYSQRLSRKQGRQYGSNPTSMDARVDASIERGLAFLARHQSSNGSWNLHHFAVGKPYQDTISGDAIHADSAATGLALLSFMGAGYHHRDDTYQEVVQAAVEYLTRNQQSNGNLYVSEDQNSNRSAAMYSHGIAAIALCEAYGMTLDGELKKPAQDALEYITQTQHRRRGGWRYQPNVGTDTSVSGWMMMALKSGQLANLNVPASTYLKIVRYLDRASTDRQPYLFAYNPFAPDTPAQRHGRKASTTVTAVGLLMRLYSGWRRDHPDMIRGADYLLKHRPTLLERDTYFWYYSTQVMFHMGGEHWEKWNQRLYPLLTSTQANEGPLTGSWDPHKPVHDKWGKHAGRLYVTTMNLLSLEVSYRHLPIYEEVADE